MVHGHVWSGVAHRECSSVPLWLQSRLKKPRRARLCTSTLPAKHAAVLSNSVGEDSWASTSASRSSHVLERSDISLITGTPRAVREKTKSLQDYKELYRAAGALLYDVKDGETYMLMVRNPNARKAKDKGWCLPGGKLEPCDASALHTAAREVEEETHGRIRASALLGVLQHYAPHMWLERGRYLVFAVRVMDGWHLAPLYQLSAEGTKLEPLEGTSVGEDATGASGGVKNEGQLGTSNMAGEVLAKATQGSVVGPSRRQPKRNPAARPLSQAEKDKSVELGWVPLRALMAGLHRTNGHPARCRKYGYRYLTWMMFGVLDEAARRSLMPQNIWRPCLDLSICGGAPLASGLYAYDGGALASGLSLRDGAPLATDLSLRDGVPVTSRLSSNDGAPLALDLSSSDGAPLGPGLSSSDGAPLAPDLSSRDDAPLAPDLSSSDGAPFAPDLSSSDGAPLALDLSSSDGAPLAPDLSSSDGAPLAPDLSSRDDAPLGPDLSPRDGAPLAPELSSHDGAPLATDLSSSEGAPLAPDLSSSDGASLAPDLSIRGGAPLASGSSIRGGASSACDGIPTSSHIVSPSGGKLARFSVLGKQLVRHLAAAAGGPGGAVHFSALHAEGVVLVRHITRIKGHGHGWGVHEKPAKQATAKFGKIAGPRPHAPTQAPLAAAANAARLPGMDLGYEWANASGKKLVQILAAALGGPGGDLDLVQLQRDGVVICRIAAPDVAGKRAKQSKRQGVMQSNTIMADGESRHRVARRR